MFQETGTMSYNDKQISILETAERLFASKGFDGTSVRDIAEEAGVNLAMISYYFGSKEKLMEALFDYRASYVKMTIEALLKDDSLEPLEKMNRLIDTYVDRVMQKQRFHKIMICEQVINKNPIIINLVKDIKKRNSELIGQLIKEGQKKGVFKKKVDIILMMGTMVGTMSQLMISQDFYKESNNLTSLSDEAFELHLKKKLSVHIKNLFKAILTNEA